MKWRLYRDEVCPVCQTTWRRVPLAYDGAVWWINCWICRVQLWRAVLPELGQMVRWRS